MSNGTNLTGPTSDPSLSRVYGENTGQDGVGMSGVSAREANVRVVGTSGNRLSALSTFGIAVYRRISQAWRASVRATMCLGAVVLALEQTAKQT